jgi:hypothetical protein
LRTLLSDGVAVVGQTLAGGFERYRLVTTANFRFARDSARTGRTQRPRTVVECICDLSQIDVLMQETHGNQTLPKVTGTGDVPDPYPSL